MVHKLPPIYFYIPQRQLPAEDYLKNPDTYWQWQNTLRYGQGRYNWTLQTYLHLKHCGFPCQLVGALPTQGIVLAHRDFLPDNLQPTPPLFIICLRADRAHHPYAQLHVVQNPDDEMTCRSPTLWPTYYMPHWPQSGLIPRRQQRGDQFENIAFFGVIGTLAPELQTEYWQQQVSALGLQWQMIPFERWHDYSNVDTVVAVRSFDDNPYNYKPASKLYNAWHAGVPIIVGRSESAYRHEKKSPLDYLDVASVEEAIAALKRLRDDSHLRQAMIKNGWMRAKETTTASLRIKWCQFLTDVATPAYERWSSTSTWQQKIFLLRRYQILKWNNLKKRFTLYF